MICYFWYGGGVFLFSGASERTFSGRRVVRFVQLFDGALVLVFHLHAGIAFLKVSAGICPACSSLGQHRRPFAFYSGPWLHIFRNTSYLQ